MKGLDFLRDPRSRSAALVSCVGLMALSGCGGDPYTRVDGANIDDLDIVVSPYSDADTYNFIGRPKTNIVYADGSRTYIVDTGEGQLDVKEACAPDKYTLYTILPYKGVYKIYMGFKADFVPCEDDGELSPSEFKPGQ